LDPWSATARSVDVLGTLVVGDTLSYVPVELVSFTASASAGDVLLEWETASEVNNLGFELQRASSDTRFDVIGFVPASGAHGGRYAFVDANVPPGAWRYRLRQVDTDGSESYSPEVQVAIETRPHDAALLTLWPNPARDRVTVRATTAPLGDLVLRDLLGRELRRVRAATLTVLPLDGLPAGLYRIDAETSAGPAGSLLRIVR
jgi:hypothetical protein